MKFRIILLAIVVVAAFSSCSTVYRSGQTPDDVYYSPASNADAYVQVDQNKRGSYYRNNNNNNYYDDYWLRMRIHDRYRWSAFDYYNWDDYGYNTLSPYNYNY